MSFQKNSKTILKKLLGVPIDVNAKQWINFSRITFVHKTQKERLTIDVNLTFENSNDKGGYEANCYCRGKARTHESLL